MIYRRIVGAALMGFAAVLNFAGGASAETLRVLEGSSSGILTVPMNRAVIVEVDVPYAELLIANPGIADVSVLSESTLYLLGKAPGRTSVTFLAGDGSLITVTEVQVTPDLAEFKERLEQIMPGENIEVRSANDGIVLSGTVSSITRLNRALELAERYAPERVSNMMMVGGTQQVMLEVRFAEVSRAVTKRLEGGLAATGTGDLAGFVAGGGSGGLAVDIPEGEAYGDPLAVLTQSGNSVGGVTFNVNLGPIQLQAMLQALESRGLVRSLAEPNLTALSGQSAQFLAGGEYPIPTGSASEVAVEYKPFGVELQFTPVVLEGDQINLSIDAAVSSIDTANGLVANGLTIAAFSRRAVQTTVELRDGESFAIAGLLEDDFTDATSQVPWLGDIPVLGALFRSAEFQRSQTELVIIITAHLVTPTQGEALAVPTDRVRPPSEAELFLLGQTAASSNSTPTSGGAGEVAQQDFSGSYGYVMD